MPKQLADSWSTVQLRKGNRFVNANVYEVYVLDVYGRPTEEQFIPWSVILNLLSMIGFLVGSILFLWHPLRDPSLIVFAVASFADAIACGGMAWKASKRKRWFIVVADITLLVGCLAFGVSSIPPLYTMNRTAVLWVWVWSSALFLMGCGMLQIMLVKSLGFRGAFLSVPLEALNAIASVFFIVGTIALFKPEYHAIGTWNYILGCAVFVFTSIASVLVASIHTPTPMSVKLLYSTTASFDKSYGTSILSSGRSAILRNNSTQGALSSPCSTTVRST